MRRRLLQRFSAFPDGVQFLVRLRADMLPYLKADKRLQALDVEMEYMFSTWFDVGFLDLRRITWDSPASLVEKLIKYEAVHDIRSWSDVKNRLDSDRRCYGFFHPRLPDEPLIFVEVALTRDSPAAIAPLLDGPTTWTPHCAAAARTWRSGPPRPLRWPPRGCASAIAPLTPRAGLKPVMASVARSTSTSRCWGGRAATAASSTSRGFIVPYSRNSSIQVPKVPGTQAASRPAPVPVERKPPGLPITVFGPPPSSGTRDAFLELVMDPGAESFPMLKQIKEDDAGLFTEIAQCMNNYLVAQRIEDALSALVHLGYSRSEAFSVVMRLQQEMPEAKLDTLIRDSLRELAA